MRAIFVAFGAVMLGSAVIERPSVLVASLTPLRSVMEPRGAGIVTFAVPACTAMAAYAWASTPWIWKRRRPKMEKLSLIHISEPTRQAEISYAVFCLKKKKQTKQ